MPAEGAIKQEAMDSLLKMLQQNPELFAFAKSMMTEHSKTEKEKTIPVKKNAKQYRHVMIHTTCEHCGFISHRFVTLTKSETISYTSKTDRQVYVVKFQDCAELLNVQATTSTCNACPVFIEKMDIDELRIRYWNLLNRTPFDMKHPPVHSVPLLEELSDTLDKKYGGDIFEDSIVQENQEVIEYKEEVVDYESSCEADE